MEDVPIENQFLTIKQVATLLGVTKIYVRKLLKEGLLAYNNLAAPGKKRVIRINKEVVKEFIRQGIVK